MKTILKKWLPDIVVVVMFALVSFAYFFPADIEGRILFRHDASAGSGAGQETAEYQHRTGKRTRWTNALFSGMPNYQTTPVYDSTKPLEGAIEAYHLWMPENVWYLFAYLLGFYILLRAFDFRWYLAALGSIFWAFSTYFLIIIAAGHIWKSWALAYLPPMIAGITLAYRGKFLWGLVVTAIFGAFEVYANHYQMTYYYLFIILFMVIAWLVDAIREKQIMRWLKATGVCIVAGMIAIALNLSNLYHTWQYSKETMRGKSELVKKNVENQTSSGLERNYITEWSYGIDETWTLLIPNAKGGSHHIHLKENAAAMDKCDPQLAEIVGQWYQYWGEQPFTAGPVYVGALVMMLFILGLFIVRGTLKWALLAATVLSVLLAWGKNFMGFTDLFIDYMPMYAKFRTVSSILVIAEFTIPLLAMLALRELILRWKTEPQTIQRYFWIAFGLTAGFCLLFALMPTTFFNFTSATDMTQLQGYVPQEYIAPLMDNLSRVRVTIFTADCWRSFIIILIGTAILLAYRYDKLRKEYMVGLLIVLSIFDLWPVNKRYLNDAMFVPKNEREVPIQKTQTDEIILQDKTLDYRVINLAGNTFNENETSYFHKSIGGYHAAKLRRYQELIEAYIAPEMTPAMKAIATSGGDMTQVKGDSLYPILNMLNTRYFIMPLQSGQTVPIQNPYTLGNAWIVDEVKYAKNANEELDALAELDLRRQAIADEKFRDVLGNSQKQDSTSIVKITSYEPNELHYDVETAQGGVIVFSEIYYPGWKATVDGEEVELGRVNYVLRALPVKAGKHEVVLSFFPTSVDTTETIAYVGYIVLLLFIGFAVYCSRKKDKTTK